MTDRSANERSQPGASPAPGNPIQSFAVDLPSAARMRGAAGVTVPNPVVAAPLKLKPRQVAALAFIKATIAERGIGPSIKEICDHLDLPDENTGKRLIERLIGARLICRAGPPLPRSRQPSLVVIERGAQ